MLAADIEGRKEENMSITKSFKNLKVLAFSGVLAALAAQASAGTRVGRVYGGSTESWQTCVQAGNTTTVTVIGDGDTDLDLYVYDDNGYLIDSDTDPTDYCVAIWTPRRDGCFTIKVVNRGRVYNLYSVTIE
jgi:hypothetical protein